MTTNPASLPCLRPTRVWRLLGYQGRAQCHAISFVLFCLTRCAISKLLKLVFTCFYRNASINTSDRKDAEPQKLVSCFVVERRNVFAKCFSFGTQLLCDTKPWGWSGLRNHDNEYIRCRNLYIHKVMRNNKWYRIRHWEYLWNRLVSLLISTTRAFVNTKAYLLH